MNKRFLLLVLITFVVFITVQPALAGGSGMGNMGGMGGGPPCGVGNFPPCPPTVPIDGGILLLAGAGLTLGARKFLKKKETDTI